MTNKKNGTSFEERVKKHYEKFGWFVIRAGGSYGAIDLACFGPSKSCFERGNVHLLQCKVRNYLTPAERKELFELHEKTGHPVLLVGREKKAPHYKLLFSEVVVDKVIPIINHGAVFD